MGQIIHRDVQSSGSWDERRILGEINDRLYEITQAISNNRYSSLPQVTYLTATNETRTAWVPLEEYEIESVTIVSTTAAGTVDLSIDGVSVGGSTPFALTTSPVTHSVTAPNETAALSPVAIVTAGLTGACTIAVNLRRLN